MYGQVSAFLLQLELKAGCAVGCWAQWSSAALGRLQGWPPVWQRWSKDLLQNQGRRGCQRESCMAAKEAAAPALRAGCWWTSARDDEGVQRVCDWVWGAQCSRASTTGYAAADWSLLPDAQGPEALAELWQPSGSPLAALCTLFGACVRAARASSCPATAPATESTGVAAVPFVRVRRRVPTCLRQVPC